MDDRTSTQAITESVLANKDLLPSKQTWNWYNIFAFWMSDVHSAGGYIFAGTLFSLGLAGWQVFVSLIVGIVIIQGLANIIGVPSQKLAVPFPVISRMTYGVFGANIPALIRGGIAVVWYGIQTYLASAALMIVVRYEWPDLVSLTHDNILGLSTLGWYCFAAMWVLQTALFLCNMEAIRRFMDWAGPIVYIAMLVLMVLIVREAAWENISFSLTEKEMGVSETIWTMIVGAALVVSYFCGPTLNFGDFSRYAKSPSQMKRGNFWGLPVNFVANFVSAAFDISNIFPKYISWRTGGLVASVLSVALLPWNLFSSPEVIHVTVDVLAALIGPVYGILIIDYYYIKRRHVVVHDLYSTSREGSYWYRHGVNWKAVAALIPAGIASVAAMMLDSGSGIGNFTFFIGAFIAAGVYRWIANSDIIRD